MARKVKPDTDLVEKGVAEGTEKVKGKGKPESEPGSMKVVVVKR